MAKATDDSGKQPIFEIVPGRYYLCVASVGIPDNLSMFGKGGDITLMLWRNENEPTVWHMPLRFRHYKDMRVFNSDDVKKVRQMRMEGDQAAVELKFQEALKAVSFGERAEIFWIRGDEKAFHEALETRPPDWMHKQTRKAK